MPNKKNFSTPKPPKGCTDIFSPEWSQICSGDFPEDLQNEYSGYMLEDGDPYSVFQSDVKPQIYLIVFRNKKFAKCFALDILTSLTYRCVLSSGVPVMIKLASSRITCVNYAFKLADDLVSACLASTKYLNEISVIIFTEQEAAVTGGIIHSGTCSNFILNIWIISLLVLISILVFFRFK